MIVEATKVNRKVNCRVGSLENRPGGVPLRFCVNCRVGSLEILQRRTT